MQLMASEAANDFDPVRDADLLETEIWQLFAAQNTGFSWVPEKKATPGPQDRPFHGWPRVLLDLANKGRIDRGRLIDETLAALWRGFRPETTLGFRRYLDYLELTVDETAAREGAFRDLLRHGQGPIVGEVIEALKQLHDAGRLDVAAFLKALPAALGVLDKGRLKSALSLVERIARQAPAELPLAALAIVPALNHESTELQDQAVKLLDEVEGGRSQARSDGGLGIGDVAPGLQPPTASGTCRDDVGRSFDRRERDRGRRSRSTAANRP